MNNIFTFIKQNNFQAIINLLKEDSNVIHHRDDTNMTPLLWSSYNDNLPLLEHLLKYSPNLDAVDNMGYTALHFSVEQGNYEITECLLTCGASPSIRDNKGRTILLIATANQNRSIMLLLSKYLEMELADTCL